MQNDYLIARANLVDKMGSPEDAQALLRHQSAHLSQQIVPRADIKPHRRFIQ